MGLARTKIIGILNVTPDSFSDGGRFFSKDTAIEHVAKLIADGAAIIDVGGESSAPGAAPVPQEEEWRRLQEVLPKVVEMAHSSDVKVSIDTRNAQTSARALDLGVDYINDVGGLMDPEMLSVAARSNAGIIIMHNFGIPVSSVKQKLGTPEQLVEEVIEWLRVRADALVSAGVDKQRIIIDPGIGFGKSYEYSWHIIKNISQFRKLGLPICVGHSRKSMFSVISVEPESRDFPTAVVSAFLLGQEVDFIRVHDVFLSRIALEVASMLL
ncbi:dihydropteroate synthase [Anaplasma capra]|uniref:dihydropteroate synthase n=1 Tax=Anaplasma capra TaxID=1562740 RepID=UPI0021D5F62C|nr:dihydropteroate synthase [Anaplasma capra]MCU7611908.1 dihydropteroate synthase [Anaplasma capra]MCU7612767.1 dihydropteroate synthase [Anaplasma capra]